MPDMYVLEVVTVPDPTKVATHLQSSTQTRRVSNVVDYVVRDNRVLHIDRDMGNGHGLQTLIFNSRSWVSVEATPVEPR
jgi:hypothetical protein